MKKLLAILMALTMLVGLLAGCGDNHVSSLEDVGATAAETSETVPEPTQNVAPATLDTGSAEEEAERPEASYTLPISEEGLTYTAWMTYAPFAAELIDVDHMKGLLVLDTIQELTNIRFDITAANGAAEQDNFNLMVAAGDFCDILSSMNFYSTGLEGAVEEDVIRDLADILPEKCPTYWSYLSENTGTLMRAYTDSGYMPAICVLYPELGQEVVGPVLRGDWLKEFDMEMPKTLDDLYAYLETANVKKGAIYDLPGTDGLSGDLALGMNISLGDFEVIDGKVEYGIAQPAFKDYLTFMNRLYTGGLISQDFFSDTAEDLNSVARLNFGLGTNSLISVGANNTSDIMMNVTEESFEMAVMPYVSADGKTENHLGPTQGLTDTMKDDDAWCISTECRDIEPLLELVEFLFSEEGYYLTNYGVEGESYTMENGEPVYTDLIVNNPDGLSTFFASYVYATNAASGFFPYLNDMSRTFYDFNDNQWQVYEDLMKLSDCAYNYPAYATLTTAESTEYSTIESDLSTYMDSKILEFITGTADIDAEFDAFVETLYDMGLQDMVDMKQAAYDRAAERVSGLSA